MELDKNGNIITKPVTGWTTHLVAGSVVLLGVRYVNTPEELERGENKVIQFALNPAQALELAGVLTTAANKIETSVPPGTPIH